MDDDVMPGYLGTASAAFFKIAIRVKEAVFDLCKLFVQCFFVGGVCQSQFFLTVQVFFIHGRKSGPAA